MTAHARMRSGAGLSGLPRRPIKVPFLTWCNLGNLDAALLGGLLDLIEVRLMCVGAGPTLDFADAAAFLAGFETMIAGCGCNDVAAIARRCGVCRDACIATRTDRKRSRRSPHGRPGTRHDAKPAKQLDQRTALPNQCLHSAEADVLAAPRGNSGFDPIRTLVTSDFEIRKAAISTAARPLRR